MIGKFHDLHERAIGARARDHEPGLLELIPVFQVELVAVPMPLGNLPLAVRCSGLCALGEHGRLGPQPHRPPLLEHSTLLLHQADHRMRGVAGEFRGVGPGETGAVPGDVDHGALHPQADAEERHLPLPREADRLNLALDPPLAEAAGHDETVEAGEQSLGPFALDVLALDRLHPNLRAVGDAAVVERLVDALVGIAVLGVLAYQGDRDLVLGIAETVEQVVPLFQIGRACLHSEPTEDDLVNPVRLERQRHLVDRKVFVPFLDHRLERHVAEERDFFAIRQIEGPLGATDEHVGLDADLPQQADGVLRRLGLELTRRLQIRHEREVDEHAIFAAHIERNLADGFQKRQALDVAHRAADLGDHHVGLGIAEVGDHLLDLVGDVGNHLHCLPEKLAAPLLVDHRQVDLAGRVVAPAGQRRGGEAFVVAEIEVGLAAVVEHVDLAVLVGAHRPGIDVDVGVELLHLDPQAAGLEQHADRGAREPLAQRTDDTAGHENMPGHCHELLPVRRLSKPPGGRAVAVPRPD